MYTTDKRWLVDKLFRHSELINKEEINDSWWELIEIEEAIFDRVPTPIFLEMTPFERQQLYESCIWRWLFSIGIKDP